MSANKSNKEPFSSPKGMRDILEKDYYHFQGFFEKAQEVAIYYGFKPIETPILEKTDVFTRGVGEGTDIVDKEMYSLKTKGGDHLTLRPEGTAGVMRSYIENGMQSLPQPVMLYYYGPYFRHESPQRGRFREFRQFGLEIIGTQKSIADAVIIRTMVTILEEAGFKNVVIEINSIGDKECRPQFIKQLTTYYRKHINELCVNCRDRLRTNPLRLLDCKNPECITLKDKAPDVMTYLCHECKQHFKEVLEYLEEMKLPYKINKSLVRGLAYYSKTVFEIIEIREEKETLPPVVSTENSELTEESVAKKVDTKEKNTIPLSLAGGGRYDYLAKALGSKKDVHSVGGSLGVDRIIMASVGEKLFPRIIKKPKVYFIQLGSEAKLKSLAITEMLRKAKIPIVQALSKDSLVAQLGTAEKMGTPYVIIYGQKEALDGTVIVRTMETRSQESVKLSALSDYLKRIK